MNNDYVNIGLLSEDNDTNDFLYTTAKYGERPSRTSIIGKFKPDGILPFLKECNATTINTISEIIIGGDDQVNTRYFVKLNYDIYVSYLILNVEPDGLEILEEDAFDDNKCEITNVSFIFKKEMIDVVNSLIEKLEVIDGDDCDNDDSGFEQGEPSKEGVSIYTLNIEDGALSLDLFTDTYKDFKDISYYYNDDVMDLTLDAIDAINEKDKGIVTISGEIGVGKTNLLKYIISNIKEEKRVVYVPVQLFDAFNSNDINRFVNNNPNTVFLLDDFDGTDYTEEQTINSIVHLVDGFKSDIYKCHFIICKNHTQKRNKIYSNNIHTSIEIGKLTLEKSKRLRKLLKLKNTQNDMRLVSILREVDGDTIKKVGY